jgi:hypothetical protein
MVYFMEIPWGYGIPQYIAGWFIPWENPSISMDDDDWG